MAEIPVKDLPLFADLLEGWLRVLTWQKTAFSCEDGLWGGGETPLLAAGSCMAGSAGPVELCSESVSLTCFPMILNSSCCFLLNSHKFSRISFEIWVLEADWFFFFFPLGLAQHLLNNSIWLGSLILSVTENYISIAARSSLALSCEWWFSTVWKRREPLSDLHCSCFDG